ncbi:serrate RNA effector molecule homolog isoform X1 [Daphnia pulex]|uniref:serrate RNA effector molecule homolog isoform X1 n=1 Tax=Daphnia pulex TaxID=6669 RepID=UPI001EDF263B|nr:serrate RNA effector molecule homolog isoform X1 [Daphnia pulex]XP_046452659.1 serrate RNA effector molecule homolog isoform X1 [Daphnia pulex]
MGDSDDDYDRRRRDKFRGERSEYRGAGESGRREERGNPRREEWNDSRGIMEPRRGESWSQRGSRSQPRHEYRESYRGRERYSPAGGYDAPQAPKRMRPDWEDRRYGFDAGYGPNIGSSWGQNEPVINTPPNAGNFSGSSSRGEEFPTQPPMMSFKAFLAAHDDSISDEEAVKKYAEYKLEFRRQQLNEFFTSHKDEEWFKLKYHPEENQKRKNEHKAHIELRMKTILDLMAEGSFDQVTIDADQSEKLVKLLDTVVIKLEGGNELDLQVLDNPPQPTADKQPIKIQEKVIKEIEDKENDDLGEGDDAKEDGVIEDSKMEISSDPKSPNNSGKRKRSGFESDSGSDWEREGKEQSEISEAPQSPDGKPAGGEGSPRETEAADEIPVKDDAKEKVDEDESKEEEKKENGGPVLPRELHRTASIFLRNLAPTITKLEVEAMCKRYPGFLRAAIADPQPERRWFRRGWVTFERNVNIKEICWNLNNIRLRDTELGAIVNRDLSRRIRTVSGITSHKQVVRNDIRLAAKIIQNLDARLGLWAEEENDKAKHSSVADSTLTFSGTSRNPVLNNITDFLIEEASAEEEELLGASANEEGEEAEAAAGLTRDDELIKVLDRLLFYLRIVHSVDYYNHCEYPNEDEMPNRCGIMHARGIPPSSKVTQNEINDYCRSFENKIASFLEPIKRLSDEEASKLGLKESKAEVEKFVAANTQELAKDKWLCPLSGKKFKGPDFVRKHVFNKHAEKIDEVRKDVEYFNNYLRDPKRPQLPEHPGNRAAGVRPSPMNESQRGEHFGPPGGFGYGAFNYGGGRGGYGGGGFGGPPQINSFSNAGGGGGRDFGFGGRNNRGGRGRGGGPRHMSHYRDLDRPNDEEF